MTNIEPKQVTTQKPKNQINQLPQEQTKKEIPKQEQTLKIQTTTNLNTISQKEPTIQKQNSLIPSNSQTASIDKKIENKKICDKWNARIRLYGFLKSHGCFDHWG